MGLAPGATDVTVRQVLEKLDGNFAATAKAVENGEFALWGGSGISRKAPSLGGLISSAMEYLRVRAVDPVTEAEYVLALDEALQLAGTDLAAIGPMFTRPSRHGAIATRSSRGSGPAIPASLISASAPSLATSSSGRRSTSASSSTIRHRQRRRISASRSSCSRVR